MRSNHVAVVLTKRLCFSPCRGACAASAPAPAWCSREEGLGPRLWSPWSFTSPQTSLTLVNQRW